jgi:hypothetical protein
MTMRKAYKYLFPGIIMALAVRAVGQEVPAGLFENFDTTAQIDSSIWYTNWHMHDDGITPVFDISYDNQALKYDMMQHDFFDGISWQVQLLDLTDNPRISLDIKIEDATYDDLAGGGPAPAASLPVQISLFGDDPVTGKDRRIGNFTINVPAAGAGEGTFETYYFDMTAGPAWDPDTSLMVIDSVTWILFETVTRPGVYDATIWIDNVAVGDEALVPPLPKRTGFAEDFEGEINMDIWDANRATHTDGETRIFTVSGDNGTLKVEMNQAEFHNGEMFIFTEEEWVLDLSDPANQVASMKVKVEDATYDGGTGPVAIATLPFQVSLFADVDDPDTEEVDRTRVAAIQKYIPVSQTGEGEFTEYYFDFTSLIAGASAHKQEQAANIWAILVESVVWPGTHIATYWLDDVRLGDEFIPYVPSGDATIHASLYGVLGEDEITMVNPGLSVTEFLLGLTVHDLATVVMLESSGGNEIGDPVGTDVATGMAVLVTAEDGTTREYAITTDPAGIERYNAGAIAIYPNPAQRILNISHTAAFEKVRITSITGQTIGMFEITGNSLQLDISGYDAGVYFLLLEREGSGTIVRKFIKK